MNGFFRRRGAGAHLTDERLLAMWEGGGAHPHLDGCAACRTRIDELRAFLDAARVDLVDEADAVFTPESLATQRASILRRLEKVTHPARVITFPAMRRTVPGVPLVARRWVALAAAAGLLVGLVAGMAVDFRAGRPTLAPAPPPVPLTEVARSRVMPGVGRQTGIAPAPLSDEAFLRELESAADRPRVEELQALDALTPHVRPASNVLVR